MELNEQEVKLKGSVTIKLIGPDGNIKQEHTNHNLVVTVGKSYLATWLTASSQSTAFMAYMALGTGTSGPTNGDTALGTEFVGGGYSRVIGVLSSASNVWTNTSTFGPGNGTGAITEAGLFSTISSGTMMARQVFAVYNKAAGDTLSVVWNISFS